jgi:hypothetical protein
LEAGSEFRSAYRRYSEDIPHTRNNWVCYNFKERRIVPVHSAIRSFDCDPGFAHLESWLVKTSSDWKIWSEIAREDSSQPLNGAYVTGTFMGAGGRERRFIRLVNLGKTHFGDDWFMIYA